MVVHQLNVNRSIGRPTKAEPVLVVDPITELTFTVTFQWFQPITGRGPQKFESLCGIELSQLPRCALGNRGKPLALSALKEGLCVRATEPFYHLKIV
jgi:hypothetical protein